MSKTALPLALAALLAAAPALAQNGEAARSAPERAAGPSLVDRAKSAGRSIADKTRNLMHRGEQKVDNARKDDDSARGTGAMGNRAAERNTAGRSDKGADDSTRKERMDQAYGDWQRRNGGGNAGSTR